MATIKKCKGVGKAKGQGCNTELPYSEKNGLKTYKAKYGLGFDCRCYSKWLISSDEGKKMVAATTLKVTKPTRDLKEFEEKEKENKSLSWLLKNTVIACHNYIRKRDQGKPCASCKESYNSRHQAGHFYKAELFSSLKFNEDNIHGQCVGCNVHNEGNESQYRVNLPNIIGKEKYAKLNRLAAEEKIKNHKWDREKLKETRAYYLEKIKQL